MPRDVAWWALRKLDVEESLVRIVLSMYRNTRSRVRVYRTFSDDFLVQVGLHQGSVLSPLLFILVLEAPYRQIRSGCIKKLLYADDWALVRGTVRGLKGRLKTWKGASESQVLIVNFKKIKMIRSENAGKVTIEVKFPGAVCRKGCR